MVLASRTKSDARAVGQPQSLAFGLLLWHFQSFLAPDSLDSFVIHLPALPTQQCRHPAVAVPTVLARHLHDSFHQSWFIAGNLPTASLRAPRLAQHSTRPAFGHAVASENLSDMRDRVTPLRRAQKFPEAASF